jgi:alpha-L-fucosidase 2
VDLGASGDATVTHYSIQNRKEVPPSNWRYDSPPAVALHGSHDGTRWTELQAATGLQWTSGSQTQVYNVPEETAASYRFYRLYFSELGTNPSGARQVVLAGLELSACA